IPYNRGGKDFAMRNQRRFSNEFKRQVIQDLLSGESSPAPTPAGSFPSAAALRRPELTFAIEYLSTNERRGSETRTRQIGEAHHQVLTTVLSDKANSRAILFAVQSDLQSGVKT